MSYNMNIPPVHQQREFSLEGKTNLSEMLVPYLHSGAHVVAKTVKEIVEYKEKHGTNLTPAFGLGLTGLVTGSVTAPFNPIVGFGLMFGLMGAGIATSCLLAAGDMAVMHIATKADAWATKEESTNQAVLRRDIFETAKKAGILPISLKIPSPMNLLKIRLLLQTIRQLQFMTVKP